MNKFDVHWNGGEAFRTGMLMFGRSGRMLDQPEYRGSRCDPMQFRIRLIELISILENYDPGWWSYRCSYLILKVKLLVERYVIEQGEWNTHFQFILFVVWNYNIYLFPFSPFSSPRIVVCVEIFLSATCRLAPLRFVAALLVVNTQF